MDRETKWGIGFVVLGLGVLIFLGLDGALSPPFTDNAANRPIDLIAIGGAVLLTASGAYTIVISNY